ncbi:MAG: hypothetical protein ABW185_17105 [Sedimenticola sp.]
MAITLNTSGYKVTSGMWKGVKGGDKTLTHSAAPLGRGISESE